MIELSNVSKTYFSNTSVGKRKGNDKNAVHALKNASLSVPKGAIHGVIGLSGAGKSTLIRCVNLLERPTSGSVTVDGQEMTRLSNAELNRARHRIGM
ncbi:MAG: ATP-binding cassette domain-containing protein, partial [Halomonas sp.]